MRPEKLISIVSVCSSVLLAACESQVEITPPGGGGTGGEGMGGGGSSSSSSSSSGNGGGGGNSVQAMCADACVKTADGTCFPSAACVEYCEMNAPAWPTEVAKAFATCAAENPLCFETVPNCILSQLHPAGKSHPVTLEGSGFDAYNGKRFFVWHDPGLNLPFGGDVIITGGMFAFKWFEPVAVGDMGTSLLLGYIDMDDNGTCNAATDVTVSINPQWNGDYLNPAFSAVLTPPLADPDFVCSFPP
jgi:hypothetical protein